MQINAMICAAIAGILCSSLPVSADTSADQTSIDELQLQIQNRKAEIAAINNKLSEYKSAINAYAKIAASLQGDLALIDNEIAMAELDVTETEVEIEAAQLELKQLENQMQDASQKLDKEKIMLSDLVFALHKQDQSGSSVQIFLGAKSFDDVFRAAAELESVNSDLRKSVQATKEVQASLEDKQAAQKAKLAALADLQSQLALKMAELEEQKNSKEILAAQTANSESEYIVLMSELRQEQQEISTRINQLQDQVNSTLESGGASADLTTIAWPLQGVITTTFHDPTYPFIHIIGQHSGLDLATPQGTPVGAAAPGVVAWARTGRGYGNYVMIIHANGLATLYAHLSKINVKQDEYVTRGQIIGLSGGRPGTQGAGFSTGPHLHFEVRQGGIPVDPAKFLPAL